MDRSKLAKIIIVLTVLTLIFCACSKEDKDSGDIDVASEQAVTEEEENEYASETINMLVAAGVPEDSAETTRDIYEEHEFSPMLSVVPYDGENGRFPNARNYLASTEEGDVLIAYDDQWELLLIERTDAEDDDEQSFINILAQGDAPANVAEDSSTEETAAE